MSNVKVNGNAYNDITSVRLPLADGSGYAVYEEGQSAEDSALLNNILSGSECGDLISDNVVELNNSALSYCTFGVVSLPNAVKFNGLYCYNLTAADVLLPNILTSNKGAATFSGANISGTLDLRKYCRDSTYGSISWLQNFLWNCTIGTVRIDSLNGYRSTAFNGSTITNLVWGGADLTAAGITADLNGAKAITNLYITDAIYNDVAALIGDGTITKVTNLYRYSEWGNE